MYKTEASTLKTFRGLITVEMDDKMDTVSIYVRESIDRTIVGEGHIDMTPEDFFNLVSPILQEDVFKQALGIEVI